jgi:hypothetical protein
MKLSDQLFHDFLREAYPENIKTRTYNMSYDYLIDLIEKVKELEDKANKYDDFNDCMLNWHSNKKEIIDKATFKRGKK